MDSFVGETWLAKEQALDGLPCGRIQGLHFHWQYSRDQQML